MRSNMAACGVARRVERALADETAGMAQTVQSPAAKGFARHHEAQIWSFTASLHCIIRPCIK
jgi:hypothetical protein